MSQTPIYKTNNGGTRLTYKFVGYCYFIYKKYNVSDIYKSVESLNY